MKDMRRIHDLETGSAAGSPRDARERQRLASRNDEFERVLGVSGIGFCRVDPQQRIAGANAHFKTLFGFAPDATLTWQQVEEALVPEDRTKPVAALRAALEHGEGADL